MNEKIVDVIIMISKYEDISRAQRLQTLRSYYVFVFFLITDLCAKSFGGRAALMISRIFERYG